MQLCKVIRYSCAQIQPILISGSLRNLSTSSQLFKHNQRRYREAKETVNEKSKSRRDAARELMVKANRTKWEQEVAQLNILKGRVPTSDAYIISEFEPVKYSLSEAVELLREGAQPDMYDCMDNAVRVKLTLNMCTKKKTKFIQKFESHVVLPNLLNFMPKYRVLAICQDSDDPQVLLTAGALDAGGSKLIQRISQGQYHWAEYDTVVAHQSWESSVSKLRHILKERSPTVKNGRLGENVVELTVIHSNGTKLSSTSVDGIPEIGFLEIILGQVLYPILLYIVLLNIIVKVISFSILSQYLHSLNV
ncbi:50S ribosomal protein L1 [Schistosoma japonicum]|nr:50S ribosomal protein L1 [Schistosoma japonicum]